MPSTRPGYMPGYMCTGLSKICRVTVVAPRSAIYPRTYGFATGCSTGGAVEEPADDGMAAELAGIIVERHGGFGGALLTALCRRRQGREDGARFWMVVRLPLMR
ncbi:hypothetical protein CYMTET_7135 [Cymbomonas tetramitiformis]|uniref:Uncharacterized protein n=1 Tax=Cymbomonas tetramitiformis TaxID=36881 RepID=A0AAE0GVL1_9CHLO|nr:hypothetical protein CYMTET_7135 [Cymbomonas tetramitiformis]